MLQRNIMYSLIKLVRSSKKQTNQIKRPFHLSLTRLQTEKKIPKEIVARKSFETIEKKNKNTYLEMVKLFSERDVHRRGHVEFIYSALKHMEMFGVQRDLEVYKSLIEVFPKGKFIPQNIFQSEFMHYPKQQQCAIDLLEQMEDNGVMPDAEMEDMLLNVFGKRGHPLRKYWRMMYWMPKFKNLSPWPVPDPPPDDTFDLAKMAVERITSVDVQSKISIYYSAELEDSIEDTWIVSSQSPTQKKLLLQHNVKKPIYVEGPFRVWLRNKSVNYFILRAEPKPVPEVEPEDFDDVSNIKISKVFCLGVQEQKKIVPELSVHEQEDGVILALCATGTSSKDSLLSWIRCLERDGNEKLADIPIVFTLRTAEKEITEVKSNEVEENLLNRS